MVISTTKYDQSPCHKTMGDTCIYISIYRERESERWEALEWVYMDCIFVEGDQNSRVCTP